ncbi:MAG TPA: helix-hairpin-helix domain-containing protein, partial [Myxococcota bacterium]
MDNREIAAVFLEMGELLQIQGGDQYRARAFRRTAQIIEGIREPIADKMKRGDLERIPGIGPGSVERVKSIITSGTCVDHQKLLARLPVGLREVVKVRGMGPRHARLAFELIGVHDVATLTIAAKNGALAMIPGVGQKTVERVLAHLEDIQKGPAPRLRLDEAVALGERIIDHMREEAACSMIAQTGSARRRKETVGDLDILVA